jgi:nucleotide-binding universal stress UspA family protein
MKAQDVIIQDAESRHPEINLGTAAAQKSPQVLHVKKILVPIDFSAPCNNAFKYALGFARQFESEIIMIHVLEPAAEPFAVEGLGNTQNELVLAEERMQALADGSPRDGNLYISSAIRKGVATHEIVEAAKEFDVDLIIMATHGLNGWKHFGMGSTADRVARAAPCPVLTVREKEHEFV